MTTSKLLRQRGFGLIEILVTILILVFGLLGVAGLLVKGVSNAANTEARVKANKLLADMADRVRANPAVALSTGSEYFCTYAAAAPTTGTIAANDVKDWKAAIANQLPLGAGEIIGNVTGTNRILTLGVRWSACIGTMSDADTNACKTNSSTAFQEETMELRL